MHIYLEEIPTKCNGIEKIMHRGWVEKISRKEWCGGKVTSQHRYLIGHCENRILGYMGLWSALVGHFLMFLYSY